MPQGIRSDRDGLGPQARSLSRLAETTASIPATFGNRLQLLDTAEPILRLIISDIDSAKNFCHQEFSSGLKGGMVDFRFFKQDAGVGQWIDVMVRFEGPEVFALNAIFRWDWEMGTAHNLVALSEKELPSASLTADNAYVQVIPSGPGRQRQNYPPTAAVVHLFRPT